MLERELFEILEGTADAAFTVNEQGLICSWNHAAEKIFGYPAAEVFDKPCAPLFQGCDPLGMRICSEHCTVLECALEHREVPDFDMEAVNRSGQRIWVNVSILALHDRRTGRRLVVHLARDIAKRKTRDDLAQQLLTIAKQITSLPEEAAPTAPVLSLTAQERKVLRLLAEGKSPEVIARELHITPHTLRNHLHHANLKLHTRSRLEAVVQATRRGLI